MLSEVIVYSALSFSPVALYVYRIVPPFAKVKTFYYCCKLFPFTFYTTFTHVSRIADEIGMIYPRLQSILSKSFAPPSVLNSLSKRRERRFESVWEDTLSILHISLGLIPNITNKHIWYSFWFNSALCSHGDVALWALVENLPPFIVARNQTEVNPKVWTD